MHVFDWTLLIINKVLYMTEKKDSEEIIESFHHTESVADVPGRD